MNKRTNDNVLNAKLLQWVDLNEQTTYSFYAVGKGEGYCNI